MSHSKQSNDGNLLRPAGLCSGILAFLLWTMARAIPGFGEYYAVRIYPILVRSLGGILSWIPWSVAEIVMYAGLLLLILSLLRILGLLILSIRRPKKDEEASDQTPVGRGEISVARKNLKGSRDILFGYLTNLASLASILLLAFLLGGGINYYRTPFSAREGLAVSGITREELEDFCQQMVKELQEITRDMEDVEEARAYALWPRIAGDSIHSLGEEFPSLAGYYPRPKPVALSRFLTIQQITGIYSPFTIEANYNQEVPDYERPFTICHELSHLKGFMREDEANFIAWLACYQSEDLYFHYSGALEGFCYAGNALFKYDKDRYWELRRQLPKQAEGDLQYAYNFWHQFDGPVAETHEKINDAYLKANNQKDGVESYGRVVNLMVGYMREQEGYR